MISQANPQATVATPDRGRRLVPLPGLVDGCLALAAGLSVLAVHNVTYILRIPFWLDESWVAASVRAPLRSCTSACEVPGQRGALSCSGGQLAAIAAAHFLCCWNRSSTWSQGKKAFLRETPLCGKVS
jgi:hypothetical protein